MDISVAWDLTWYVARLNVPPYTGGRFAFELGVIGPSRALECDGAVVTKYI